jgi:hypothetical protein
MYGKDCISLVWFGLVFVHSVTHVTLDMSNTGNNLYRVNIKEIDTFNVIKTVSIVDTQFA